MFVYETCVLLNPAADDAAREKILNSLKEVVESEKGDVLIADEWGLKSLAQPTSKGLSKGFYLYMMYKGNGNVNTEIERRLRINEAVVKHIMIKLGEEKDQEKFVKAYKTPYASNSAHRPSEEDLLKGDKEKKLFARRKSCWFSANKIAPDWKNPYTYKWLVNEFGKISPARVTSLTARYQRASNTAIKRARCIGLISYTNNRLAQ